MVPLAIMAASDHDQLGAQRTGLAQGFQDGDQIAGRGPDLVDGLDDIAERGSGREEEHAVLFLFDLDIGLRNQGLTAGERAGLATAGFSLMVTVRLPCEMAAGRTVTPAPMTTVPVRALMTTRAGGSAASRVRFSSMETKVTR
jgi:hypothetical protein